MPLNTLLGKLTAIFAPRMRMTFQKIEASFGLSKMTDAKPARRPDTNNATNPSAEKRSRPVLKIRLHCSVSLPPIAAAIWRFTALDNPKSKRP